jgi:hypothetical protein
MHRILGIAAFASAAAVPGGGGPNFTLTSPDIREGATIASVHVFNAGGCTGENQSPELDWHGAPAGTRSFAVTVYDPDAPTGSGWWHWLVFNLPSGTTQLPRGAGTATHASLPTGAEQGRNDFGAAGYGGPCPPPGKPHHYVFTVYALDVPHLDIPEGASAAAVGFDVHAHMLAKATLTALYGR